MVAAPRSRIKVGMDSFLRRFQSARTKANRSRVRAIEIWGEAYTNYLAIKSPRNTNRYVRGWIQAGNMAGVTSLPEPRIVPLRETERGKYIERLQLQLDVRQKRVDKLTAIFNAWYASKPNRKLGTYGRKLQRELKAAENSRDIAWKWLTKAEESESFLFMAASPKAKRKTASIREKVYGGVGSQTHREDSSQIMLRNKEPHCRILEARLGLVREAKRFATQVMRRQVAAEYVKGV